MRTVQIITVIITITVLLCSCGSDKSCDEYCSKLQKTKDGTPIVRLQQQWFANSGFAGEILAQYKTSSKYDIKLEVLQGSDQIDTKQIVKMGEAEFGVAGAEQVMQANEKGAGFVVIGVINYRSLACFISKKNNNIIKPKDMEGHKIGTMEGSPVDLVYQALKKKEGLTIDKSNEIPTGWVLTGFELDQYDVYPAFINDEPIKLQLQGMDVNTIVPSNYGVNFIGTVYFCKKELVECCPKVVQSFVNSIIEGWEIAIKDPKLAIDYLKKYDANIDEVKEFESLQRGMDYYKGEEDRVLYTTKSTWADMKSLLINVGYIKSFDYENTVQNKFISWYHSRVKGK